MQAKCPRNRSVLSRPSFGTYVQRNDFQLRENTYSTRTWDGHSRVNNNRCISGRQAAPRYATCTEIPRYEPRVGVHTRRQSAEYILICFVCRDDAECVDLVMRRRVRLRFFIPLCDLLSHSSSFYTCPCTNCFHSFIPRAAADDDDEDLWP
ncbi:hypothetical protein B0H12DRAFT_706538 [Mycena haematopus]|nr:hypothetical protein B0H12DRAFT_706538 [Mycena haematopus]